MAQLVLESALLSDGWARDVLLEVDTHGALSRVQPGAPAATTPRVRGATVPGVPNLHSHVFQRAMAGRAESAREGDTFWTWRRAMYRLASAIRPDDMQRIAAQLGIELLRHGYTALGEFHYLHHAPGGGPYGDPAEMACAIVRGICAAGLGLTIMPAAYVRGGFDGSQLREGQLRFRLGVDQAREMVGNLQRQLAGHHDLAVGIALHSLRAVDPGDMRTLLDGLDAAMPVHIHAAEQLQEVEESVAALGARPVEWLLDNAELDRRWCLVHATHMTQEETRRLASTGAVVALCPTTEANLGDGIFPAEAFVRVHGRFGVGSDSQVSVDPAEELRLLEYGQRLTTHRRGVLARSGHFTGAALLRAAWDSGASALGRPIGAIAPGCRADLVVLDLESPTLTGLEGDAILDAWIFGPGPTPVRDVMVGGRWMVQDGKHPAERPVLSAYRETVRRLQASAR